MKIIISPAKKMKIVTDYLSPIGVPVFLEETKRILKYMKNLSYDEAKALWNCNDKIATDNYAKLKDLDVSNGNTPAILAYDGIAFLYMAPSVFEFKQFDYVQKHLRILSGFYGVLKAMDGVVPYRLEMQAKVAIDKKTNLYEFWGNKIYNEIIDEDNVIINLASREYSKVIEKYLQKKDRLITCTFGEKKESLEKGKIVQKGTYAKMARGEMVRFMAENNIESPDKMKNFDRLGYEYSKTFSNENNFVFLRGDENDNK